VALGAITANGNRHLGFEVLRALRTSEPGRLIVAAPEARLSAAPCGSSPMISSCSTSRRHF
jgi:hypothetical protein